MHPQRPDRRQFLRSTGQAALASCAPWALNLAAMSDAAAFSANDYKALVCVFLFGGNDYANTVVNYDVVNHAKYASIRAAGAASSGMVLTRENLAATVLTPTTALAGGKQYALNPNMTGLAQLFNAGKAAVQLNVGPLVVPLTRAQYHSGAYPLPPKLFSHNDQQSIWQTSAAEGTTVGWGGHMADQAMGNNSNSLFSCISVSGNNVFLSGDAALQYQCSIAGPVAVRSLSDNFFYQPAMRSMFETMLKQPRTHALENEYNTVMRRAIQAQSQVSAGIANVQPSTRFPSGNDLADQLKMVARLIGTRSSLGAKRQVFMVSLNGFDLHDFLPERHGGLLKQVDEAISAFYQATVELGVAQQVTTFTASDFGRTLTSNGDGSDHGWGSHHFVVGGSVNGAAFYGTPPPVSVDDSNAPEDQFHVGQGRLLPTTSVTQYAATLAQWFGVPTSAMSGVLPYYGNFGVAAGRPDYPSNLGFMR